MKSPISRTLIFISIIGLAVLASCRPPQISANPTGAAPTTDGGGGGGGGGVTEPEVATMNAVGTAIAAQTTEQAGGQVEGVATQPVANTPVVVEASPTPAAPAVTETPAAPVATATPVPPAVGVGCPNPYTVKEGDWIYKIARDCNVEPSAIVALNPGINPNRIVPGQQLNMPAAGATAVPPATPLAQACTGTYTIKTGDNLFRIAYNCGLTTENLAAFNAIPFPYTIYVGDVIKFP